MHSASSCLSMSISSSIHEPRVISTHGQNLLLGLALHLMITTPQPTLLVLPREVQMEERKDEHTQRHQTQISSVTFDEPGPVFRRVQERRYDTSGVAQHDLRTRRCGPTAVSRVVGVEPSNVETKSNVDTGSNHAAAEVENTRWAV